MSTKPTPSVKKKQRCREDWILKALDVLRKEGLAGVRAERLARDLNVTKGSFYHHFKNLADLQEAILDYWMNSLVSPIKDAADACTGGPQEKLITIMDTSYDRKSSQYDMTIRGWALRDERAAQAVAKMDEMRLNYIIEQFQDMGFTGLDAETRARLFVVYNVTETSMYPIEDREKRQEIMRRRLEILTKK
jgi:AcrR family transcriptional regulator